MNRFIFCIVLAMCSVNAAAQRVIVKHPALRYHLATNTYALDFPATSGRNALPSVAWSSKTLIDPQVDVQIERNKSGGEFEYRYVVRNGATARQKITLFALAPIDSIAGVDRIKGLAFGERIGYQAGTDGAKRQQTSALLSNQTKLAVQTNGKNWRPTIAHFPELGRGAQLSLMDFSDDMRGMDRDQSMSFRFKSNGLPGLISIPFEGDIDIPLLPSEEDRTDAQTEAWYKVQKEDVFNVTTIAPRYAAPAPYRSAQIVDAISVEVGAWKAQKIVPTASADQVFKWLSQLALTPATNQAGRVAIINDLRNYLHAKQDTPSAVQQLIDIYVDLLLNPPDK